MSETSKSHEPAKSRTSSLSRSQFTNDICSFGLSAASRPKTVRTRIPSRMTTKFAGTASTRGHGKITLAS